MKIRVEREWGCLRRLLWILAIWITMGPLTAAPRSRTVIEQFQRLTGYPHGRPDYVVDHQIPLCAGGPDRLENLQWQALTESRLKDRFERALCAALIRQGYRVVKLK